MCIFLCCRVKFGAFYEYLAKQQTDSFDRIASGHYARIIRADDPDEPVRLALAPDAVKDQTYFLAHLSQDQLSKVIFPLGHLTKVGASNFGSVVGAVMTAEIHSWEQRMVQCCGFYLVMMDALLVAGQLTFTLSDAAFSTACTVSVGLQSRKWLMMLIVVS